MAGWLVRFGRAPALLVAVAMPIAAVLYVLLVVNRPASPDEAAPVAASSRPSPAAGTARPSLAACTAECRYVGVALAAPADLTSFVSSTGVSPRIVEVYEPFGTPFPLTWASSQSQAGRLPLIQINPHSVSLAAIAAGRYDRHLAVYGAEVARLGRPVALSFGHEMNGTWYPWGCHHTTAATFVAAYRHVVTVVRDAGARNVIWVWTANAAATGECAMVARYPGNAYVTWVGIDGYLRGPGATFGNVFQRSLAMVRHFSGKPVLLAQVGVAQGQAGGATRLRNLYSGAAVAPSVIGVVYFDAQAKLGDYRPQDSRAALAAFKRAVARYSAGARSPGARSVGAGSAR